MSNDLVESTRKILHRRGTRQRVSGDNLIGQAQAPNGLDSEDNPTLREGEPVPVFARKVESDTLYAWGYGSSNRNKGRDAFVHSQFVADGSGTGADGDVVTDGELWARVMGPRRRRVKAETMVDDLSDLNDAVQESLTDKPMFPVQEPAAKEDRWIELAIVGGPNADGVTIDSDSDVRFYYTDIDMS